MSIKPTLWISRKLPTAVVERAAKSFEVLQFEDDVPRSSETVIEMSGKAEGFLACNSEKFTADVVLQLDPRLKIIANYSVGYDHCDVPALTAHGITVTNTPEVLSEATAETAMLLLLGAARRAVEGDKLVRTGQWDSWSPSFMVGKQVSGARLGIVGMGRIGQVMARMARGFGMEIHYYNRSRLSPEKEQGAIYHSSVEDLLPTADFLSLHCPATAETTNLMSSERFALMPDGSVLVNTARGAVVDEQALMTALDSGKLAAAGLDVFQVEPGGNSKLAAYDNVFMLPHIGSATFETRNAMGFRALDNLEAFFSGKEPGDKVT
jgi:lactate dehydrogenase-like 2-hydroxyacid dehydrogenase